MGMRWNQNIEVPTYSFHMLSHQIESYPRAVTSTPRPFQSFTIRPSQWTTSAITCAENRKLTGPLDRRRVVAPFRLLNHRPCLRQHLQLARRQHPAGGSTSTTTSRTLPVQSSGRSPARVLTARQSLKWNCQNGSICCLQSCRLWRARRGFVKKGFAWGGELSYTAERPATPAAVNLLPAS